MKGFLVLAIFLACIATSRAAGCDYTCETCDTATNTCLKVRQKAVV
jgi:hypothetical protein